MHAGEVAEQDAGPAEPAVHIDDQRIVMLPAFAVRAAGDDLAGKRPGLETADLIVIDGGRPAIFAAGHVGVVLLQRHRRAVIGMQAARLVIPGMHGILARMNMVHELVRVGMAVIDAALHDDRRVAAVDGRPVVALLMREIAP